MQRSRDELDEALHASKLAVQEVSDVKKQLSEVCMDRDLLEDKCSRLKAEEDSAQEEADRLRRELKQAESCFEDLAVRCVFSCIVPLEQREIYSSSFFLALLIFFFTK